MVMRNILITNQKAVVSMNLQTQFKLSAVALALASCSAFAQSDDHKVDEQMVITATHTETAVLQAPASISVISEEEIMLSQALRLTIWLRISRVLKAKWKADVPDVN